MRLCLDTSESVDSRMSYTEEGETMGGLTPCNYCTLQRMKANAEKRGNEIILRGLNAYVVKKGEKVQPGDEPVAWFMELTNYCCC